MNVLTRSCDPSLEPQLRGHPEFGVPTWGQQELDFRWSVALMAHPQLRPLSSPAEHHIRAEELAPVPTGQRKKNGDRYAFLMGRRKTKTTVFLDDQDNTSMRELKIMIAGIT